MSQKLLLEDLSIDLIHKDLALLEPRKWSNLVFIKTLLDKHSIISVESAKITLETALKSFYNNKIEHPKSAKFIVKLAKSLEKNLSAVLASNIVEVILKQNLKETSRLVLNENLVLESYDTVNSINRLNSSFNQPKIAAVLTETSPSSSTPTSTAETPSNKRRKYLKATQFKDLSFEEKVIKLNENYGESNVLDLTKRNVIPKRFKKITEKTLLHYGLVLDIKLLNQEYDMLTIISNCKTIKELNDAVNNIDPFSEASELPYIRLAIHKLCNLIYRDLLTREHHEDWYRINVYGDLFDFIFTSKTEYTTKRSECHSSIIKRLKQLSVIPNSAKDIKLDFIFSHMNSDISDSFFCEDKSTEKEEKKDGKKAKYLREKSLQYWTTLLPYKAEIQHLTSISCQFNRLKLQIKATKIINGITIHVLLKEVRIPTDARDSSSIVEYLTTIISLVRMVTENFEKLRIMSDAAKEDDLVFANSMPSNSFRDDSSISSKDSYFSDESQDLEGVERKIRIIKSIEVAMREFQDQVGKRYFDCTLDKVINPDDKATPS